MKNTKLLILEDSHDDATLIQATLKNAGLNFNIRLVATEHSFIEALDQFVPEIIISDHQLPSFTSSEALLIARQKLPLVPFVLVTGTVSEEFAADIIKAGADDYILKDRLSRLPVAITAAIRQRASERERMETVKQLQESELKYRNIMERVSDAFVAIDKDWHYTYVNKSAGEILNRLPGDLIGKHIWTEFPEAIGQAFYKAYLGAFQTQRQIHLEAYYAPLGLWLENNIYPSPNGLSIFFKDITARKKSAEIIIESEEKYRNLVERISDGFFAMDLEWKVTYINSIAEHLLDKPPGYMFGKRMTEEFPHGIGGPFYNAYQQALLTGKNVQMEGYAITLDKWLYASIQPSATGISVFLRDVTEKKKAEQQQQIDSSNLSALINNTNDLMWSIDKDLKVITFNDSFDNVMKLSSGRSLVKGDYILSDQFTPEQIERYQLFYARALSGETFSVIDHFETPTEFWSEISFYPIRHANKIIGTACYSRDITESVAAQRQLKQSYAEKEALAERMSAIINTLAANIALIDERGIIIEVNDSWRDFASANNFRGDNYCIGDNYLEITAKANESESEDGKNVFTGIKAVLQKEVSEFEYEYPCHSPGLERWFRMMVSPLQQKEYAGAVVMHIDISEIRRLEKERIQSRITEQKAITSAMLQAQEKERNHIGQELHDNVNQILAGTKMYMGIAGKKNSELEELIKYPMELLDKSMEEIRILCRNLVTPLKDIDLEQQVKTLLGNFERATNTATDFSYRVPADIFADDLKLNIYRILQEQINNISKYAAANNVYVNIEAHDGFLNIVTADDGQGFDVDKNRNGIGISNMINRIEFFNGTIKIKSKPGSGCVISIKIPF